MAENLTKAIGEHNLATRGSLQKKFVKISKKQQDTIKEKMNAIVKTAQLNIKACHKDSHVKYQNEMDIYYHLEFTRYLNQSNSFIDVPNSDCEKCRLDAVEKLKLCLSKDQLPNMIADVIQNKHLTNYLRSEYQLSHEHSQLIIKSFSQLTTSQESSSGR
jgi:hypothetical protein